MDFCFYYRQVNKKPAINLVKVIGSIKNKSMTNYYKLIFAVLGTGQWFFKATYAI